MDTMIHCIIHLPNGEPKKALLLFREGTRPTKVKRTRHSNKEGRAVIAKHVEQLTDEQFDKRCRQIARDEMTRVRLGEEFQEGMRGVARYEAKREIVKVLENAVKLEEEAGR